MAQQSQKSDLVTTVTSVTTVLIYISRDETYMLVKNGLCVFARIGVSTNSGYSGYIP